MKDWGEKSRRLSGFSIPGCPSVWASTQSPGTSLALQHRGPIPLGSEPLSPLPSKPVPPGETQKLSTPDLRIWEGEELPEHILLGVFTGVEGPEGERWIPGPQPSHLTHHIPNTLAPLSL